VRRCPQWQCCSNRALVGFVKLSLWPQPWFLRAQGWPSPGPVTALSQSPQHPGEGSQDPAGLRPTALVPLQKQTAEEQPACSFAGWQHWKLSAQVLQRSLQLWILAINADHFQLLSHFTACSKFTPPFVLWVVTHFELPFLPANTFFFLTFQVPGKLCSLHQAVLCSPLPTPGSEWSKSAFTLLPRTLQLG